MWLKATEPPIQGCLSLFYLETVSLQIPQMLFTLSSFTSGHPGIYTEQKNTTDRETSKASRPFQCCTSWSVLASLTLVTSRPVSSPPPPQQLLWASPPHPVQTRSPLGTSGMVTPPPRRAIPKAARSPQEILVFSRRQPRVSGSTDCRGGCGWGHLLWALNIDDFTTQRLKKHFG